MAAATNGASSTESSRFDPNFTQNVINAMGPKTSPRMREVMSCLTRHLHDFAREIELTVDEWMEGVKLLNWAGQMSNDRRNEGQLMCDVVGLETCAIPPTARRTEANTSPGRLVDEITYKKASEAADLATQSAILGPFFQTDHKIRKKGETCIEKMPEGAQVAYVYGKVIDAVSKKPVANASIDIWEASTNGKLTSRPSRVGE
jgi:catechol 1,2-dioxygenase